MTFLERLDRVVKLYGGSGRELCRDSGLSESYLGALTTRLRKDPSVGADAAAISAIAEKAGVSTDWLLKERGPMFLDKPSIAEETFPVNLRAVTDANPGKWRPITVQRAAMRRHYQGGDLTQQQWFEHLESLDREERRLDLEALAASSPLALPGARFEDEVAQRRAANKTKKKPR